MNKSVQDALYVQDSFTLLHETSSIWGIIKYTKDFPFEFIIPNISVCKDGNISMCVCKAVLGEVRLLNEFFSTFLAFMISNTSVRKSMFSEGTFLREFLSTFLTFIVPNTSVCKDVLGEGTFLSEFLPTIMAFMIPNTSVCKGVLG